MRAVGTRQSQDKAEREQLFAEKSEAKAATEADRLQENSEMTADKNFMDVLTGDAPSLLTATVPVALGGPLAACRSNEKFSQNQSLGV